MKEKKVSRELPINDPAYDEWFKKLKEVAVDEFEFTEAAAESFDKQAWREYFDDGMSPYQALREDLSYD